MKKYIYSLFFTLLATVLFVSCKEEQGSIPGSDEQAVATVYSFTPKASSYNPDNDILIRVVANSPTSEVFYLTEKKEAKATRLKSLGEGGYKEYVVKNGTKVNDIAGASSADFVVTGLVGEYKITIVAVGSGSKSSSEVSFTGLEWIDLGKGSFKSSKFNTTSEVTVMKEKSSEIYKIVAPYVEGYDLIFKVKASAVTFEKQETGSVSEKYGMISFGGALNGTKKSEKTVTLVGNFTVSAGSFGTYTEVLELP